jgi:hypothetical protein
MVQAAETAELKANTLRTDSGVKFLAPRSVHHELNALACQSPVQLISCMRLRDPLLCGVAFKRFQTLSGKLGVSAEANSQLSCFQSEARLLQWNEARECADACPTAANGGDCLACFVKVNTFGVCFPAHSRHLCSMARGLDLAWSLDRIRSN